MNWERDGGGLDHSGRVGVVRIRLWVGFEGKTNRIPDELDTECERKKTVMNNSKILV